MVAREKAAVLLVAVLLALAAGAGSSPALSPTEGDREFDLHQPPGGGQGRPLVVWLHGCTQTGEEAVEETRFAELAERERFSVLFPEQDRRANASRCWNWFSRAHQKRDSGEPAVIAGLTRKALEDTGADRRRVFVAGMSAGGAMAVVMAATWPDLYAAAGVVAGCEYRGLPCLLAPSVLPPETSGRLAYEEMGPRARPVPVMVIHGDADRVVPPANGDLVVRQWLTTDDYADDGVANGSVDTEPAARRSETAPGGPAYDVAEWRGPDGRLLVERWLVAGLGHSYPTAPDATAGLWAFFEGQSR